MNLAGNLRNLMGNQPTLQQFVGDAQTWRLNDLAGFVKNWKYSTCKKIFSKSKGQVDAAIATLNPEKHALAYSYLVGFKACEDFEDPAQVELLLAQVNKLIDCGDSTQICVYPRPMTDALRFYCNIFKKMKSFKQLIPRLKQCITILQGNKSVNELTFAHCELMEMCVETLQYNMAFPTITTDIVSVQGGGCIESFDNLRYHYYIGCIYIGLKNYGKALECLTMVCTAPSEAISVVQIAAYKKYVLVCLIEKQSLSQLPRYTPNILKRYFNKFCSNYTDLATNFNNGKGVVSKLVEKNYETYQKDRNFGLVKQMMFALDKNAVTKLTSVYTRLSIERVKDLCDFDTSEQAKRVLIEMIRKGELNATIDAQGVVTFGETITKSDGEMLETIHKRIKNTVQLWNTLDKTQLEIKQNPDYIKKNLELPGNNEEANGNESMFQSMLGNFA